MKNGISLITLIVTIIVVIILTAAVILSLSDTNIISEAEKAVRLNDEHLVEQQVELFKSEVYLSTKGNINTSLIKYNETTGELYYDENENDTLDEDEINIIISNTDIVEDIVEGIVTFTEYDYTTVSGGNDSQDESNQDNNTPGESSNENLTDNGNDDVVNVASICEPKLGTGMTPIKFDSSGNSIDTTVDDSEWYQYIDQGLYIIDGKTSKWANARTQDGSQWVWIPRYAYKLIEGYGTGLIGIIDVVFIDVNNVAENGVTIGEGIYSDYIVHPAFKDGSSVEYKNGEWDSEITGFWFAKYQAGYADSSTNGINTSGDNYNSSLQYSSGIAYFYDSGTYIKYPVFMPNSYSYNYINIGDSYLLSKALNENNNPYGFDNNSDTHMAKNSEWGAVTYLGHSKYGRNGNEIRINGFSEDGDYSSSYKRTVTGMGWTTPDAYYGKVMELSTISNDNRYNGQYGKLASTTGNLYGIYDMSGGAYEFTPGYINNGNGILSSYGSSILNDGTSGISNKYKTVYPYTVGTNYHYYDFNDFKIGDAIYETSVREGTNKNWFSDYYFHYTPENKPFICRGGYYSTRENSGSFASSSISGSSMYYSSFRVAIIN